MSQCPTVLTLPGGVNLYCLNELAHGGTCRFELLLSDWAENSAPALAEIEQLRKALNDSRVAVVRYYGSTSPTAIEIDRLLLTKDSKRTQCGYGTSNHEFRTVCLHCGTEKDNGLL